MVEESGRLQNRRKIKFFPLSMPSRVRILDVNISTTSYEEVCRLLEGWGRKGSPTYICICNVHTVMEAHKDPTYASVLNNAAIATPDGMPLVWALRQLGHPGQGRVYGPELLLAFAKYASKQGGLKNYFYGAREGVAETLARVFSERFPGFTTVGIESPPFRPLTLEEDEATVERINRSGAHVLLVGLGAPKQERWMADHLGRVKPVMVGVGAAFDFCTGNVRQAPRWMRHCGLEWLFRLAVEPKRLWRRYLFNNPHFLYHLAGQLLRRGR